MYEAYATREDYYAAFPDQVECMSIETIDAALLAASRKIDSMTFNRIHAKGFENLTPFQQERVTAAVCEQMAFDRVYGDMLSTPLASYGINGVSMAFGGPGLSCVNGVQTSTKVHDLLKQTGLTYRGLAGRWG